MSDSVVGIIMGSKSDWPIMQRAMKPLGDLGVPCEVGIKSVHRTSDKAREYVKSASGRGMRIIIAGAGGSAALPGMAAAWTHLPVIGVPIKTDALNGMDSLLSIVQMPPGVPVATVAINGAENAALFAIRMLAISDEALAERLIRYIEEAAESVEEDNAELERLGLAAFLNR